MRTFLDTSEIIFEFPNALYDNGTHYTSYNAVQYWPAVDVSMQVIIFSILEEIRVIKSDELQTFQIQKHHI